MTSPHVELQLVQRAAAGSQAPLISDLGSPPTPLPDVPVTAVFLGIYLVCLVLNCIIYWTNNRSRHRFWISLALIGFCLFRVITTALRLAWAYHQTNPRLGIASQVFFDSGIAILYISNLFLAQRIVRARQPKFGWSKAFTIVIWLLTLLTLFTEAAILIVDVQSFLTQSEPVLRADRDVQLYALTYFLFVALMPLLLIVLALLLPRSSYIDKFGTGRFRWQLAILALVSLLLTLEAGWRCGTAFADPVERPARRPWYFSSACFYLITFMLEVLVLVVFLAARIDRRFYVPDGASGPGSYSRPAVEDEEKGPEWPEAVYLPVTEVQHSRNARQPTWRQNFLQVDPRTGRYQLAQAQESRGSLGSSSMESRRGRWSRTSWDRQTRRSMRSLRSYTSRTTPRRSRASLTTPPVMQNVISRPPDDSRSATGTPGRTSNSSADESLRPKIS